MSKQVSKITDVAKLAGVSPSTVSRVINNTVPVNDRTRQLVEKAMQDLNFTPNVIAQGMRKNLTYTVGVVIPDYANIFYSYMFTEIEKALSKYGYMAIICPTSGDVKKEKEYVERLLSRKIDGIIFFTYSNGEDTISYFNSLAKKTPLVLMDESSTNINVSQVYTDGYNALYSSTKYLIDQGHTRIGCLSSQMISSKNRLNGYLAALKDNGIPVNEDYIFSVKFNLESGSEVSEKYLSLQQPPTAFVSVADYPAIGLIYALTSIGVKIPQDVEIISFDNIDLASCITPKLSTVAQPIKQLAGEAVNILMEKINDKNKWNVVKKVIFRGELILRDTTK